MEPVEGGGRKERVGLIEAEGGRAKYLHSVSSGILVPVREIGVAHFV